MHDKFLFFIALFTGGITGLLTLSIANKTICSVRKKYKMRPVRPDTKDKPEAPSLADLLQSSAVVVLCCIASLIAAIQLGINLKWALVVLFSATLLLLVVVDLRTHILPNTLVLPAILLGTIFSLTVLGTDPYDMALGATAASCTALLLEKIYFVVSGSSAIGLGNVKLLLCCGAISGLYGLPKLFLVAFSLICLWLIARGIFRIKMKTDYIPIAPCLIAGTFIQILF